MKLIRTAILAAVALLAAGGSHARAQSTQQPKPPVYGSYTKVSYRYSGGEYEYFEVRLSNYKTLCGMELPPEVPDSYHYLELTFLGHSQPGNFGKLIISGDQFRGAAYYSGDQERKFQYEQGYSKDKRPYAQFRPEDEVGLFGDQREGKFYAFVPATGEQARIIADHFGLGSRLFFDWKANGGKVSPALEAELLRTFGPQVAFSK